MEGQAEVEAEQGDPLRHEFWQILERYESFLQREMWIGDDKEVRFEMNFPVKKEDWPGTLTVHLDLGRPGTWWR